MGQEFDDWEDRQLKRFVVEMLVLACIAIIIFFIIAFVIF